MSLSGRQIELIEASFAQVLRIREDAARYFYARLFEIAPEIRPMFRGDMALQRQKLMATLGIVVQALRDMPELFRLARQLAERHVGYGVRPEHYPPLGQALLDTIEGAIGSDLTAETRAAWAEAYALLSRAMLAAAYPERVRP